MVNLGSLSLSTSKSSKPMVSLSFWIPYFTHWGESLLVCGSAPGLGSGNVKKGLLLKPSQQDDQLIWSGSVSVPPGFSCDYCYYVVDDSKNVLRSEFGMKRKLVVPETLTGGESVQFRDLWQVCFFFFVLFELLYRFCNLSFQCCYWCSVHIISDWGSSSSI